MEQENEPKKKKSRFSRNTKYDKPEVGDRIVTLHSEGKSWVEITNIMREELDEPKMADSMSRTIYNRAIAKTITTERKAGRKFRDYTEELDKMYGKAINVLQGYITAAEKVSNELINMVEKGNITAVKAYGIILKTAPQMKAITSEIRDFMRLQREDQDKIKIEQSALIWDEGQMLDYMDKYLKQMEKEGKIIFVKPKLE